MKYFLFGTLFFFSFCSLGWGLLEDPHLHRIATFQPQLEHRVHLVNITNGIPSFLTEANFHSDPESIAFQYLTRLHYNPQQIKPPEWVVTNKYTTEHNGITHIYLKQTINDLIISNADVNINIDSNGRIINIGDASFISKNSFDASIIPPPVPVTTHIEAINSFARYLKFMSPLNVIEERSFGGFSSRRKDQRKLFHVPELSLDDVPVNLMYTQVDNGQRLSLVWHLTVKTSDDWLDAYIDANNVESYVAVYSWVAHDTYLVYDYPIVHPLKGSRILVTNPADLSASPLGWVNQGDVGNYTTTAGNNALIQNNPYGRNSYIYNYRPDAGRLLEFSHPIDFTQQPVVYQDAALDNLFYWNNIIHDIFYIGGFNEISGNFQENNFNKGGKEKDAVQANGQDGSGYNNANFATPPDGQRPRMRMYLWNQVTPNLDGDIDSGIIVHEYGHGISNRLTGGPDNVNCLPSGQAGGMGEGWGDWWAILFEQTNQTKPTDPFPMGIYAAGRGIRPYPYTADFKVNPQTFIFLNQPAYIGVHAIGSVWCTTLFEVYWELVAAKGFNPDWYVNKGTAGNQIIFQNVLDGLKLQPCNPNFVTARDAILLADKNNYGGANVCSLWRGFARRGLGVKAVATSRPVVEDFTVPPECS